VFTTLTHTPSNFPKFIPGLCKRKASHIVLNFLTLYSYVRGEVAGISKVMSYWWSVNFYQTYSPHWFVSQFSSHC